MKCKCWRKHSLDYPRGQTPPQDIESLQAAWDRDQELIFEMKQEIGELKDKVHRLQQKLDKRQKTGDKH